MIYPNIRNLREDRDLKQRELADVLESKPELADLILALADQLPAKSA